MRKGKNTGRTMDPDMPVLRPSIPPTPTGPSWRGRRSRGGGWGGLMPTMDEFFGTSTQVCGGFWPFSTDMALPVEGVPIGRSMTTGAGVCCDPISWFRAGIIEQPSMFVMGLPAIGKSTFVRRQVWGMSALGMNAIIPGDLKPDYAELVRLLGGQVIRLGSGLGSINPLDPGGIHDALKRLTGDARKDLLADYHERRSALMEVLLTISRTGREEGRRTVSDVESNVLSTALKILYERTKDDPAPPVIPDLRDLARPCSTTPRTTMPTRARPATCCPASTDSRTRWDGSDACSASRPPNDSTCPAPSTSTSAPSRRPATTSSPPCSPPHGRARSPRRTRPT